MGIPGVAIRQVGRIFQYAKYYTTALLDHADTRRYYSQLYNLFGDPTVAVQIPE